MIKKFFESSKAQVVFLFFVDFLLIILWFGGGKMYAGGEEGLNFYNLTKYLTLASHTWYELGTGFQLFTLLPKLPFYGILEFFYRMGTSGVVLQAVTFLILAFTGCLSVFLLIKETVAGEIKGITGKITPLISGVFYLLNPYSMSQIWGRGIYSQFFAFALVPAFLLLFVVGLRRKNLIYGMFMVFISLLLSSIYTFPGNVLMLWLIVFLYLLFYIRSNLKNKKNIYFGLVFFALTLLGWILTNLFWILPYLITSNQQYTDFVNTDANIASLQGVSKGFSLPVLLRLMHVTYFYYFYGTIYKTLPFQVISFIIPVVSLFSLTVFRKLKNYKFFVTLFLIGLFVNLGSNFPTGWLFELIFKTFPILQMFRNPYEKLGQILVLAYIPFFAIGFIELSKKIIAKFGNISGRGIIVLLLVTVFGIFEWPMWLGYFAGGFWANPWIEVPTYYKEADEWLKNQNGSLRLLQLPLNPGDGVRYNWEYPYSGIDPSEILFTNSPIGRNVAIDLAKVYYNSLLERFGLVTSITKLAPGLSDGLYKGSSLREELEKLGVGYIILHRDIDTAYSGMKNVEETLLILSKETGIKKVQTFGELDIYEVGNPQKRSIIFSPDQNLTFAKINPTHYEVNIVNAGKSFELYFLELFDEGWEAYVNGVKLVGHGKAYSYANSWRVDKAGSYTIVIKYKPQEVVEKGVRISFYSVLALGLITVLFVLIKNQYSK